MSREAYPRIKKLAKAADVMIMGPGLGTAAGSQQLVEKVLLTEKTPLLLDADGLNVMTDLELLTKRETATILTPHPGEMARLLGTDIQNVQKNRLQLTADFAREYQVYLVLKERLPRLDYRKGRFISITRVMMVWLRPVVVMF